MHQTLFSKKGLISRYLTKVNYIRVKYYRQHKLSVGVFKALCFDPRGSSSGYMHATALKGSIHSFL